MKSFSGKLTPRQCHTSNKLLHINEIQHNSFFFFKAGCSVQTYQDPEEVQILCSTRVIPTLVLELGISVKSVQIFLAKLQRKVSEV